MENKIDIDIMLENEFKNLGIDFKNLLQKPTSLPRNDYKLFDYNFEFDGISGNLKKYYMQIEFGVEQRPDVENSFQIHNMLCKAFPVGADVRSVKPLYTEYYHRDKFLPTIDEVVLETQLSIRYLEAKKETNLKSKTSLSRKILNDKNKGKSL